MTTTTHTTSPQSAPPRRASNAILRQALLVAAMLAALLVTTATASAASWQYHDVDADRYYDATTIDRDGNGYSEDMYFDLDNDGRWDTNLYNTRHWDNFLEVIDYDMDENGEVEARLLDGDQREGFDYVRVDSDQNGSWDNLGGYTKRIIPGSNVDHINRSNRRNMNNMMSANLMHRHRMQTGQSLLYPSFPMCC